MQPITLRSTNIRTSPLGFGCVSLTKHDSRDKAVRVLGEALDAGITHFDAARLYGFGQAEGILGEFLKGRRERVTVASKFGLQPPQQGLARSRRLVSMARWLAHRSGVVRRLAGRYSAKQVKAGAFEPADAAASLETSLRELGTDRIDIYFLHECTVEDARREDLIAFLEREVTKGRIGVFGTATHFAALRGDAGLLPASYRVLQFDSNLLKPNVGRLKGAGQRALITFGAAGAARRLAEAARANAGLCSKFRDWVGADIADASVVTGFLLRDSIAANPEGVTLFTSTSADRVRANVAAIDRTDISAAQAVAFAEFAREADGLMAKA